MHTYSSPIPPNTLLMKKKKNKNSSLYLWPALVYITSQNELASLTRRAA